MKYRTLVYFYRRYKSLLGGQAEREFIGQFPEYVKADEKLLSLYEAMERGFQEYVHGENQRTYQEDYMVKTKTLADLSHVDGELARANETSGCAPGRKFGKRYGNSAKCRRYSA